MRAKSQQAFFIAGFDDTSVFGGSYATTINSARYSNRTLIVQNEDCCQL